MTTVEISNRIRKALKSEERPQTEIAQAAGIHPVNLSQFKAGKRKLPLDSLVTLASVLGLEIIVKEKSGGKSV